MQLSRLQLNTRSVGARRDLADPYQMHRTLTRAFPHEERVRFLWRLEPNLADQLPIILVQSSVAGEWSALNDLINYLARPVDSKEVSWASGLKPGKRCRFRLVANPTVTRGGRRYGLMSEDAQMQWLARQGVRHGFDIEAALVTSSDRVTGRKGETLIQLQRVGYEGYLTLREPEA